jgi:hypothetical protein
MFDPMKFLPSPSNPGWDQLDRRWRRCAYLISHGQTPSSTVDDSITWYAWRYRLGLDSCSGPDDRRQLDACFPATAAAYQINSTTIPMKRWELEARLLANETDSTIAAKCGITAEAVQAYGELFYDVRPRLSADTYIHLVVLEDKGLAPIAPNDFETILKTFGYSMGGCVVDDVLDYIREPPIVPSCLRGLDLPALKRLQRHLLLKIEILLLGTPASAVSVVTWDHLRRDFAATQGCSPSREENEADMLSSLKPTLEVTALLADCAQTNTNPATISISTIQRPCETDAHLHESGTPLGTETTVNAVPA